MGLCNDAVGSANYIVLHHRTNGQILIGNDMRGSCHGPVLGTILACSWRDWGMPWKFLVCIVIPQAMWKCFIVQSSGLLFNIYTRLVKHWNAKYIMKIFWNFY